MSFSGENVDSIFVSVELDFKKFNNQLKQIKTKAPPLDIQFNSNGLSGLSKQLDLNLKQYKDVQKYFDANPLKIKVLKDELGVATSASKGQSKGQSKGSTPGRRTTSTEGDEPEIQVTVETSFLEQLNNTATSILAGVESIDKSVKKGKPRRKGFFARTVETAYSMAATSVVNTIFGVFKRKKKEPDVQVTVDIENIDKQVEERVTSVLAKRNAGDTPLVEMVHAKFDQQQVQQALKELLVKLKRKATIPIKLELKKGQTELVKKLQKGFVTKPLKLNINAEALTRLNRRLNYLKKKSDSFRLLVSVDVEKNKIQKDLKEVIKNLNDEVNISFQVDSKKLESDFNLLINSLKGNYDAPVRLTVDKGQVDLTKDIQGFFDSNPLKIKIDNSSLTGLNTRLTNLKKKVQTLDLKLAIDADNSRLEAEFKETVANLSNQTTLPIKVVADGSQSELIKDLKQDFDSQSFKLNIDGEDITRLNKRLNSLKNKVENFDLNFSINIDKNQLIEDIRKALSTLDATIKVKVETEAVKKHDIGENVVKGLDKGVKRKKVRKTGEYIADELIEGTEDNLGIQSPSRKYREIGEYVVAGFRQGVRKIKDVDILGSAEKNLATDKLKISIDKNHILNEMSEALRNEIIANPKIDLEIDDLSTKNSKTTSLKPASGVIDPEIKKIFQMMNANLEKLVAIQGFSNKLADVNKPDSKAGNQKKGQTFSTLFALLANDAIRKIGDGLSKTMNAAKGMVASPLELVKLPIDFDIVNSDEIKAKLASLGQQLTDSFNEAGKTLSGALNKIFSKSSELTNNIKSFFNSAFDFDIAKLIPLDGNDLKASVSNLGKQLEASFSKSVSNFSKAFSQTFNPSGELAGKIKSFSDKVFSIDLSSLTSGLVPKLKDSFSELVTTLDSKFKQLSGRVYQTFNQVFSTSGKLAVGIKNFFSKVFTFDLSGLAAQVNKSFTSSLSGLKGQFNSVITQASKQLSSTFTQVFSATGKLAGSIREFFNSAFNFDLSKALTLDTTELATTISGLGNQLESSFKQSLSYFSTTFNNTFNASSELAANIKSFFNNAFNFDLSDAITGFEENVTKSLYTLGSKLGNAFEQPINLLTDSFEQLFSKSGNLANKINNFFSSFEFNLSDSISLDKEALKKSFADIGKQLEGSFDDALSYFSKTFKDIFSKTGDVADNLKEVLKDAFEVNLNSIITNFGTKLKSTLDDVFSSVMGSKAVRGVTQKAKETFGIKSNNSSSERVNAGAENIQGLRANFKQQLKEVKKQKRRSKEQFALANSIQEEVSQASEAIDLMIANLGADAPDSLKNLAGDIKFEIFQISQEAKKVLQDVSIGDDIYAGLSEGVSDQIKNFKNQGDTIGRSLIEGTKESLRIESPSKVFRFEIARNVFNGLKKGIEESLDDVRKLSKNVGDALTEDIANSTENLPDPNLSVFDKLRIGVTGQFKKLSDGITGQFDSLIGGIKGKFKNLLLSAGKVGLGIAAAFLVLPKVVGAIQGAGGKLLEFLSTSRKVALEMQTIQSQINFSVGGGSKGQKVIEGLKKQAEDLKIDIKETLEGSAGFLAAIQNTNNEVFGEEILKGFNTLLATRSVDSQTQQRFMVAIQQMAGKGVQAEELRGQAGEALPGFYSIFARSQGLTTQQLGKKLQDTPGGLDASTLLAASQQAQAESITALPSSLNSTQAKLNTVSNEVMKLQENVGKVFLPFENITLDVFASGLATISNNFDKILFAATAVAIQLSKPILIPLIHHSVILLKNLTLASLKLKVMNLGGLVSSIAPAIGSTALSLGKIGLALAAVGTLVERVSIGMTDLGGASKDFGHTAQKDLKSLAASLKEVNKEATKTQKSSGFMGRVKDTFKDFTSRPLDYMFGNKIIRESKEANDANAGFRKGVKASRKIRALADDEQISKGLGKSQEIDKQLAKLQELRRSLALLEPENTKALKALNDKERELIEIRYESIKPVNQLQSSLEARIRGLTASKQQMEDMFKDGKIDGNLYEANTKAANEELAKLEALQDKIRKQIGQVGKAYDYFKKQIVESNIAFLDQKNLLEKINVTQQTRLANSNLSGGNLATVQHTLDIQSQKNNIAQVNNNINQQRSLFSTETAQNTLAAYGVDESMGVNKIKQLAEEVESEQAKFILNQFAEMQTAKTELDSLQLSLAQSQKEVRDNLKAQNQQVNDYFKGISRTAKTNGVELEKMSREISTISITGDIRSALLDSTDSLFTDLADSLITSLEELDDIANQKVDSKLKNITSKFESEDALISALNLRNDIGGVPTIPVKLDLNNLDSEEEVERLNNAFQTSKDEVAQINSELISQQYNIQGNELAQSGVNNKLDDAKIKQQGVNAELHNGLAEIGKTKVSLDDVTVKTDDWKGKTSEVKKQVAKSKNWLQQIQGVLGSIAAGFKKLVNLAGSWANKIATGFNHLKSMPNIAQGAENLFGFGGRGGSQKFGSSGVLNPANGRISSPYGWRIHPVHGGRRFHKGIDIANRLGTDIVAPTAGKIVGNKYQKGGAGKYTILESIDKDGRKIRQLFLHLSKFTKKVGDYVKQGEVIGKMGSTGASTGSHLDWRMQINGKWIDPKKFMKMNIVVPAGKSKSGLNTDALVAGDAAVLEAKNNRIGNITRGGNLLNNKEYSRLTGLGKDLYKFIKHPNILAFADTIARAEGTDFRSDSKNFGYSMLIGGSHDTNFSRHPFAGNSGSRIRRPIANSTASGRYQMMDFNYSRKAAKRQFGSSNSDLSRLFKGDNPGSFSPAVQDLYFIASLKQRGILSHVLQGKFSKALKTKGIAQHYASLQYGGRKSAYGKQGTPQGQLRSTIPFAQQRQRVRMGQTARGRSSVMEHQITLPTKVNTTVAKEQSKMQNKIIQASNLQQQQLREKQRLENERNEKLLQNRRNAFVKKNQQELRKFQNSLRDERDNNLRSARSLVDLKDKASPIKSSREKRKYEETQIIRQYDDELQTRTRKLEKVTSDLSTATKLINQLDKTAKQEGLSSDQKKLISDRKAATIKGIAQFEKTKNQLSREIGELNKLKGTALSESRKLFNFEESQRQLNISFDVTAQNIDKYKEKLESLKLIQKSNPLDSRTEQIPAMEKAISLKELDLDLRKQLSSLEDRKVKKELTSAQYKTQVENFKQLNTQKRRNVLSTYELAKAEMLLGKKQRNQSVSFDITAQNIDKYKQELEALKLLQKSNPLDISTDKIPALEKEINLKELDLDLSRQLAGLEDKKAKKEITESEYKTQAGNFKQLNEQKRKNILSTYELAQAEMLLGKRQRNKTLSFDITGQNIDKYKQDLEQLKLLERKSPLNEQVLQIPELEKEISLKEIDLDLQRKLNELKVKGSKNELSDSELKLQVDNHKAIAEQKRKNVTQTYELAKAERKLKLESLKLNKSSKFIELDFQLKEESLRSLSLKKNLDPLADKFFEGINTKYDLDLAKLSLDFQRNEQDIMSFANSVGLSSGETQKLLDKLNQLKTTKFDNLREEFNQSIGKQQIQDLEVAFSRKVKSEDFLNSKSQSLEELRIAREDRLLGSPFRSNSRNRKLSITRENTRYSRELEQFNIDVERMRFEGVDINENALTKVREDMQAIHDMNLGNINDQFKTFGQSLDDLAHKSLMGLSNGITNLLTGTQSLTGVLDDFFGNILNQFLNSGIESLMGGLFGGGGGVLGGLLGGIFYKGQMPKNIKANKKDVPAYASGMLPLYMNGGVHESTLSRGMMRERAMSGRKPQLAIVHENELIIPAKRTEQLNAFGLTPEYLLGRPQNYANGYMPSSIKNSVSTRPSEGEIKVKTEVINQREYVSIEQFQIGMQEAAKQGGEMGARKVKTLMTNSQSWRQSTGMD